MRVTLSEAARFWQRVRRTRTCWFYVPALKNEQYGRVRIGGKVEYAHRVSFRLSGKRLHRGRLALHSCDRKPCVRPSHLHAGNHSDNLREAFERGRR